VVGVSKMIETPVTIDEYSEMTGLSRYQIYSYIRSGRVMAVKLETLRIYPEATKARQLEIAREQAEVKAMAYQPRTKNRTPIQRKKKTAVRPRTQGQADFLEGLAQLRKGGRE